jgi:hypothetical protein
MIDDQDYPKRPCFELETTRLQLTAMLKYIIERMTCKVERVGVQPIAYCAPTRNLMGSPRHIKPIVDPLLGHARLYRSRFGGAPTGCFGL